MDSTQREDRPLCPTCHGTLKRISTGGEVPCTNCNGGYMRGIDDPTPDELRIAELQEQLRAARAVDVERVRRAALATLEAAAVIYAGSEPMTPNEQALSDALNELSRSLDPLTPPSAAPSDAAPSEEATPPACFICGMPILCAGECCKGRDAHRTCVETAPAPSKPSGTKADEAADMTLSALLETNKRQRAEHERLRMDLAAANAEIAHVREERDALQFRLLEWAPPSEIATLRAKLAEAERAKDRLATIIDEAFGLQPVMPMDDLLTTLEREIHARWTKHHEDRKALDAAEARAKEAENTADVLRTELGKQTDATKSFRARLEQATAYVRKEMTECTGTIDELLRILTSGREGGEATK